MINKILFKKEFEAIFYTKSFIIFIIICSLLLGYSFINAVLLYSTQSLSALDDLIYAKSFEPIVGIFKPTFGAFFIIYSLILPFIIIPIISYEYQYHTIYLITQLSIKLKNIFLTKILISILIVLSSLSLIIPSIIFWIANHGHIDYNELILLLSGYFLYGILIISISFFSITLFKEYILASIFALLIILFWWIIDFANSYNTFFLFLHKFSIISILNLFENGILSLFAIIYFCILSLMFFSISYILFKFDSSYKILKSIFIIIFTFFTLYLSNKFLNTKIFDITQSKRNSFSLKYNNALKKIKTLQIDIYLSKQDSRYKDYKKEFLNKLRFVNITKQIHYHQGKQLQKNYGQIIYKINNQIFKTYSNSPEEFFNIISNKIDQNIKEIDYKGYPLVIQNTNSIKYIYYILLPFSIILIKIFKNYKILHQANT